MTPKIDLEDFVGKRVYFFYGSANGSGLLYHYNDGDDEYFIKMFVSSAYLRDPNSMCHFNLPFKKENIIRAWVNSNGTLGIRIGVT